MPIHVNVMVFILSGGIAVCLIAMFVLISKGEKKLNVRYLPPLEVRPLLDEKQIQLQEDLSAISEKLGLRVFVKVSLGELVEARETGLRRRWRDALLEYQVDFAICDPRTHKILMAVFPVEQDTPPDKQQEVVISALDQVNIPHLQLGNYNRGGLEKAMKERMGASLPEPPLAGRRKGKSAPPPSPIAEQPADETAPQPAAAEG